MGFAKRDRKYKTRNNMTGTLGWIGHLRMNMERYLFFLHRVTGIGLVAYLILHIIVTSSRMYGESTYKLTESVIKNPYADIGLFIVMAGLIFHGVNGIRLILNEYGFLLGKPTKPIYPYREVLKTRRPRLLLLLMIVIGIILLLIVGYELLLVWVI